MIGAVRKNGAGIVFLLLIPASFLDLFHTPGLLLTFKNYCYQAYEEIQSSAPRNSR